MQQHTSLSSPKIGILRTAERALLKRQHLPFHGDYVTVISPVLYTERYPLPQVSKAEYVRSVCCNERE